MSNTIVSAVASNGAVSSIFTRAQIKAQISELKADCVHMLGSVSGTAARESFVKTCTAIAVQRAVFGSDEIYQTIAKKARTLPDYKTNKAGIVSGKLGKMLHAFGEAVAVGKALAVNFPMSQDECDMAVIARDITFGALIEAPKQAEKVTAPKQPEKVTAPKQPEKVTAPKTETTAAPEITRDEKLEKARDDAREMLTAINKKAEIRAELAREMAAKEARQKAEEKAARENAGPEFIGLFAGLVDNNKEQAVVMLEQMASMLGYKLSKAKTTVKKAA